MNRQADIEQIYAFVGAPRLQTVLAFRGFTRQVAAVFAFGFEALGIVAEPEWGIRRNSTGTISKDVLRKGDEFAVDISSGAGASDWTSDDFHWLVHLPDHEGFGIGVEPARRSDHPGHVEPPPPPPPPTSDYLDHRLDDYRWVIRHQPGIDQTIIDWYVATHPGGVPEIAAATIQHINWRAGPEFARWEHAYGAPLTLRKLLHGQWPRTGPLPGAPSFLDMDTPRGNFLQPRGHYFAPHAWVQSEEFLRERLFWMQQNRYTVVLAMLEQTHWGLKPGRNPAWTAPDPSTPLVFDGPENPVYGWTYNLDELIRRITIARREYGLEVVLSLWEQERIEHGFASAMEHTEHIVRALNPHVAAFRNSWEQDEVLGHTRMHELDNRIGEHATKPSGPHFASHTIGDDGYFRESGGSKILWHQYNSDHTVFQLADDTRKVLARNSRVTVVADEHSPAVRHNQYSHQESVERANACRNAGAFGGLNG